ncbi:MAG: glutamine synthetase family protein [Spirochaetales bacterium]
MTNTIKEVLELVREQDAKFIRLAFCDLFGRQKNISIMPDRLEQAFESGVSFAGSSVAGFSGIVESDLLLFPEAHTLAVLPWRPQQGRVLRFYCDIKRPDGTTYECDTRSVLKNILQTCESKGFVCNIGAECEFYLFKTSTDGEPLLQPFDNGSYMDIAPLDRGENVRREICLHLEKMGVKPESSHHEQGPGQNEIDFTFSDALSCADNLLTLKTVVRATATHNGLFASFMPKPLLHTSGNGLHINISLFKNGENIFRNVHNGHSKEAESFIAGILQKIPEITAFLNPTTNSYERFGSFEAPLYVSWSHQNRSQLIRIPATNDDNVRMELRSPDTAMNAYLGFSLIIAAGLEGIEKSLPLPPEINADLYTAHEDILRNLVKLPTNLGDALDKAENSDFVKRILGEEILSKYISYKRPEQHDFLQAGDKQNFYTNRYFSVM